MVGMIPVQECRTPEEAIALRERAKAFRAHLFSVKEPEAEQRKVRVIPYPRPIWEKMPLPVEEPKPKRKKLRFQPEDGLTDDEIRQQRAEAMEARRKLWEKRETNGGHDWFTLILLRVYCRTGITPAEMTSDRRFAPMIAARTLAAQIARHIKPLRRVSNVDLADWFGGRDHTAILFYAKGTAAERWCGTEARKVQVDLVAVAKLLCMGISKIEIAEHQRTTWGTIKARITSAMKGEGEKTLAQICQEADVGLDDFLNRLVG